MFQFVSNQAQYDLDRLAAEISALSSNDLRNYEYLNGEDLECKPSVLEQAKFDYSPLGKIFNKGLPKKGLLKNVKKKLGIKTKSCWKQLKIKNEKQLKAIENQGKKQLDVIEKNNELKDDKAKNKTFLKDELKKLIESYPDPCSIFVKNELKRLANSEKNTDYKKLPQETFLMALVILKGIVSSTYS